MEIDQDILQDLNQKGKVNRKLRKSCSLTTCHQESGQCMHCTCDGRCGKHPSGLCGVRREGSGKSCKRTDCLRDDSCLHSTRATCCHCRNLVSSHSRSVRVKRATQSIDRRKTVKRKKNDDFLDVSSDDLCEHSIILGEDYENSHNSILSDDTQNHITEFENSQRNILSDDTQDPLSDNVHICSEWTKDDLEELCLMKGLKEYSAWYSRRLQCNLTVLVEGIEFNLHKFPMLLESSLLKRNVNSLEKDYLSVVIPVIDLGNSFPGGALGFEMACIYCYTHQIVFTKDKLISLYSAAHYLEIDRLGKEGLISKMSELFHEFLNKGTKEEIVKCLEEILQIDCPSILHWKDNSITRCINRIACEYPYDTAFMELIQALPCDIFLRITYLILSHNNKMWSVVSKLCVQASLAETYKSSNPPVIKAQSLLKLLDDMVIRQYSDSTNLVVQVVTECELDISKHRNTGRILELAINQALKIMAKYFLGRWKLDREIVSSSGRIEMRSLNGLAEYIPYSQKRNALLYTEKLELITKDNIHMEGSRSYLYDFEKEKEGKHDIYFYNLNDVKQHLKFFHSVTFSNHLSELSNIDMKINSSATHLCGNDIYELELCILNHSTYYTTWHVTGPSKDFVIKTRSDRMEANTSP